MSFGVVLACFLFGLASQGFASDPPFCKPQLRILENGMIDAEMKDLYDPNDRIWYFCNAPYVLDGVQDVTCLPNGEWDHPPPKCVRPFCKRRDSPADGSQDPDQPEYEVGQKVSYFCDEFFALNGPKFAICLPTGEWSHPVPVCDAPTCPALNAPDNGELTPNQVEYDVGSKVLFVCDEGFELIGSRKLICLSNGEWSDKEPRCDRTAIKCHRPDDPANGNVISRDANQELFDPDQKVWFKCDDGFSLSGAKDFVCQKDGSWRPQPFPKCVPNQCKRPSDPANGHVVSRKENQQHFNAGEKVWFKCENGFVLDGGAKDFVCQKGGSWKPQPFPKCVRDKPSGSCPNDGWTAWYDHNNPIGRCDCEWLSSLRKATHGAICEKPTDIQARVIRTKELYKNNLRNVRISPTFGFTCYHSRDHYCEDYEVRYCCPKPANQCKRPSDPANGHVVSRINNRQHFNAGEKVWFKCENGFVLDGGAKDFVCQNGGSWRPQPFPKCVRDTPSDSCPDNGWTAWYDHNNPIGRCDCELLWSLRKATNGAICERPTDIQARVIRTKELYKNNLRNVRISPTYGFTCYHSRDHYCQDYEVRFCCPKPAGPTHRTVVACERDFSKYLRCPRGHIIQIVKGFYGRDDRHTCPSKAIFTDKCFAKNSLAILKRHCHNRHACRLQPSNKVFGDPCVHTYKYIKLTYFCKKH